MKAASFLFTFVFLVIIYVVSIVQGIVEVKGGGTVQFFDVLEDTFITPVKRENSIAERFAALAGFFDEAEKSVLKDTADWGTAAAASENALFAVEDIKKISLAVNRHVTADTAGAGISVIDSLRVHVSALYDAAEGEQNADNFKAALTAVKSEAGAMAGAHSRLSVTGKAKLWTKSFFKETVFTRKYLRAYESELEKTSVFANTLRPVMQFTRYMFFQDLGEKAVLGEKGWFYYKPDIDYIVKPYVKDRRSIIVDPNSKPLTDDPVSAIVKFKKQLEDIGIELLVVIIPGKPSVYPDMLNSDMGSSASGSITHSLKIMEELHSAGIETVDLFSAFADERKSDSLYSDSLYLEKDTHWKARGVRRAAHEVAERIKKYSWYVPGTTEYAIDSSVIDRVGDVGVMSSLPNFKVHDLNLSFNTEKTKCYQVFEIRKDENGNQAGWQPYRDDFYKSSILLIGDSFSRIFQTDEPRSAGWISHIAYELSQPIASIVSDGGASTLVRQTLSRKTSVLKGKKLVIWEFVERDIRYGAEGWKDVALEF